MSQVCNQTSCNNRVGVVERPLRVVFAGACGMGMLPLAILLKQSGAQVFAFDDAINAHVIPFFEKYNIPFSMSHELPDCDILIHTSAIKSNHPLYKQALEKKIPIYRRGEYFAKFVQGKKLIAVVGSHGKTTTTAILIKILKHIGFDFSYYLGGLFQDASIAPAHYSPTSEWIVAEIDESDGTIQLFSPFYTLLLNLSWDHSSFYHSEAQLQSVFKQLLLVTQSKVFINAEESSVKEIVGDETSKVIVCSLINAPEATFHASYNVHESGVVQLELQKGFHQVEEISTNLYGIFNAYNALIALSLAATVSDKSFESSLKNFSGVSRRQECLFTDDSRAIVTDYAHHPNELATFLEFAKKKYSSKNIITLFQPHRYSRTRQYAPDFARILSSMNQVHLLPVYCASEIHCEEGATERICEKMQSMRANVSFWQETELLLKYLASSFVPNTVALFIGAGDIEQLARGFAAQCKERQSRDLLLSHK